MKETSTVLCEEAVRKDADSPLCLGMTNCLMLQAVVFALERTGLFFYLHNTCWFAEGWKSGEGFLCPEALRSRFGCPSLANALLFADGRIDSWTQSCVEVVRNSQKHPCSVSLTKSWIQDLRSLNCGIHSQAETRG